MSVIGKDLVSETEMPEISPLNSFYIQSDVKGPNVLITAGVHGDEFEPVVAANKLIISLENKLTRGSVTIVPITNPSAFSIGCRLGCDNLDLARVCPGNPSGSATEQAAFKISELIANSDYYIDMHTGGREFTIFPLCGYILHSSREVLSKQRKMAEAFNLPLIWGTEAKIEGRTLSVARDNNIPAVYIEYGGGDACNREIIQRYLDGCMNILISLDMLKGQKRPKGELNYYIEDYAPGSAHLQSKMPSPDSGIFIPYVKLGDSIKAGMEWGEIYNPLSQTSQIVKAGNSGLVFLLRTPASVKKGDSLGGVLPVVKNKRIVIHE